MATNDREPRPASSSSPGAGPSRSMANAEASFSTSQSVKGLALNQVTHSADDGTSPHGHTSEESSTSRVQIDKPPAYPAQALTTSSRRSASNDAMDSQTQSPPITTSTPAPNAEVHAYPPPAHTAPATPSDLPPSYEPLPVRVAHLVSPEVQRGRGRGRGRGSRPPGRGPRDMSDNNTISSNSHTLVDHRRGVWLEPPPPFGEKQQAVTMPQYLFYFGFLCPILWLLGYAMIFVKVQPVPLEEGGQSVEDQQEKLRLFKKTEQKWAYRCLIALIIFTVLLTALIVAVVFATRR